MGLRPLSATERDRLGSSGLAPAPADVNSRVLSWPDEPQQQGNDSTMGGALGRASIRGMTPAAAAWALGSQGAAAGEAVWPAGGGIVGGIGGALLGGYLASKAQDAAFQAAPDVAAAIGQSPEQQATQVPSFP